MKRNYWTILKEDILQDKQLMFAVLFTTVLCFGFTITNFSIGVDDPARNYYLYSANVGSMIQQGRLMHVLFNRLTKSIQFIPFFTDFSGAVIYAFSALCFCAFFQFVTNTKLQKFSLIAFSCVYISSSVIAEKYIYHLDVIVTMLSYVFSAWAILYAFRFVKEKKRSHFAAAVVSLMGAISSYESFIFLYFCCVFLVLLLEIAVNGEKKTFACILTEGIQYALILCISVALYYGIVYAVQYLTDQTGIFTRYNFWKESGLGIVGTFLKVTSDFCTYFKTALLDRYLPIIVFCMFSVIGAGLSVMISVKRKNPWAVLCFAALWAGNFFIHYTAGNFMTRAAQTFCLFTGYIVLLLAELFGRKRGLKQLLWAAVCLLVFVQSADMNRWFYNDYIRYRKETFVVDTIATDLVADCDLSKPVVFTNTPKTRYLDTAVYPGRQVNGNSVIYWAVNAFENPTQPFVKELFFMHGYDFIHSPTAQQNERAHKVAETMPAWPQKGYMQELEDMIVVNFG